MEKKVLDLLNEAFPQINFEESNSLMDDGIIDSLTLVEIVSCLGMEFDVMVPYDAITPENFNSVAAIAKLVEELKK